MSLFGHVLCDSRALCVWSHWIVIWINLVLHPKLTLVWIRISNYSERPLHGVQNTVIIKKKHPFEIYAPIDWYDPRAPLGEIWKSLSGQFSSYALLKMLVPIFQDFFISATSKSIAKSTKLHYLCIAQVHTIVPSCHCYLSMWRKRPITELGPSEMLILTFWCWFYNSCHKNDNNDYLSTVVTWERHLFYFVELIMQCDVNAFWLHNINLIGFVDLARILNRFIEIP